MLLFSNFKWRIWRIRRIWGVVFIFENLKAATLRELKKYVSTCQKKSSKPVEDIEVMDNENIEKAKNAKVAPIKCRLKCGQKVLEKHDQQVYYKSVSCEFCGNLFPPRKLADHLDSCSKEFVKENSAFDKFRSIFYSDTLANANDENLHSTSIHEVFDNTKVYEERCENLPEVLIDPSPTPLDVEIEDKLSKLKLFNEAFFDDITTDEEVLENVTERVENLKCEGNKKSVDKIDKTTSEEVRSYTTRASLAATAVNDELGDKKVSNDVTETEHVEVYVTPHISSDTPVYSTPEDVHNFNNWYYAQVSKKSTKPKRKNLKETQDVYKYLKKSGTTRHCKSCSCIEIKTFSIFVSKLSNHN